MIKIRVETEHVGFDTTYPTATPEQGADIAERIRVAMLDGARINGLMGTDESIFPYMPEWKGSMVKSAKQSQRQRKEVFEAIKVVSELPFAKKVFLRQQPTTFTFDVVYDQRPGDEIEVVKKTVEAHMKVEDIFKGTGMYCDVSTTPWDLKRDDDDELVFERK
jgi:hypothetical protein